MLEPFDGKRTKWEGLWYKNPGGIYISSAFDLSKLKSFKGAVRFLARKNKFFQRGTNRPNFQFCIADSETEHVYEIGTRDVDDGTLYVPLEDAMELAYDILDDYLGSDDNYDYCSYLKVCLERDHAVTLSDILYNVEKKG